MPDPTILISPLVDRDPDAVRRMVARAIELSDTKYCSVAATVRPTAAITTTFEIVETGNQI